ncbi:hypothetical protein HIM_05948 [Hirsutella minnesotensis 3608]|uniref:Superoxide dismutase [Cu-Zn] n=1 Tax=Hirsutella minnesotensis 3608 TaxID=1043627 RepID=A0A0F7ZUC0_9HYPO|nr:hypothetical protein HIM_05948 [Hirsutella minnesotensis 3608]
MKVVAFIATFLTATAASQALDLAARSPIRLVSVLRGKRNVSGTVTFEQEAACDPPITHNTTGFEPNVARGFHVHTSGDLTNGRISQDLTSNISDNPLNASHVAPGDVSRHAGDLGNIMTDTQGVASGTITDRQTKRSGHHSIIGVCPKKPSIRRYDQVAKWHIQRAVVVHSSADDLGRSTHQLSLRIGNAGGRAACGEYFS